VRAATVLAVAAFIIVAALTAVAVYAAISHSH
jgi:hypothetical protein